MLTFSRCWNIWSPLRLISRKKRISHSCLHPKQHLWHLNSIFPQLHRLLHPPLPHRLQHRRCRPLRLRTRHRARRSLNARRSRYVHLLLLLHRHRSSLRHSIYLPNMAGPIHSLLYPIPLAPRLRPPFHL